MGLNYSMNALISRLAKPAEIQCNFVEVSPKVQHSSCELRTIVHKDGIRFSLLHGNLFKYLHHLVCRESTVHPDCYRFTGANIQNGQDSDTLSICEHVTHKVHGPDLIKRLNQGSVLLFLAGHLPPRCLFPHGKPFQAILSINTLEIHLLSFNAKQNM
jgi:hypothetical protein